MALVVVLVLFDEEEDDEEVGGELPVLAWTIPWPWARVEPRTSESGNEGSEKKRVPKTEQKHVTQKTTRSERQK